jgi:hypothetical protein
MTDCDDIPGLVADFEAARLAREEWTHDHHLRVGLWYTLHLGREAAIVRMRQSIQHFNHHHGNPGGYHETITRAWITVIDAFLAGADRTRPIDELARELIATRGARDHLLRYYSRERLASDEARAGWVPPDRAEIA